MSIYLTYAHAGDLNIRFKQLACDPLPKWAVEVRDDLELDEAESQPLPQAVNDSLNAYTMAIIDVYREEVIVQSAKERGMIVSKAAANKAVEVASGHYKALCEEIVKLMT